LEKIDKFLKKLEFIVGGTAFTAMVLLIVVNVFSRYLFSKSFAWTEEVAYLLFSWTVFFGACLLYSEQGLIAIDAVVNRLAPKNHRRVQIFTYALVFITNICLVVWGIQFSIKAWSRPTGILHIPFFFIDISIPLACMILAYYSGKFLIMTIRNQEIEEAALEDRA